MPDGKVFAVPPEQNPPHSIRRMSGGCMARLSGMASRFSSKARQAIQGLRRRNVAITAVAQRGRLFSRSRATK
ncbi:hypothetical protein GCM10009086_22750 [Pseudomonas rhodesiae]